MTLFTRSTLFEYLIYEYLQATPCVLYGITNPTPAFAQVARCLLENAAHLTVLAICFDGAVTLVRAFESNGNISDVK